MRILIDTNVVIDWLTHREPFHKDAEYIITRNTRDFQMSAIPVLLPEEFIKKLKGHN